MKKFLLFTLTLCLLCGCTVAASAAPPKAPLPPGEYSVVIWSVNDGMPVDTVDTFVVPKLPPPPPCPWPVVPPPPPTPPTQEEIEEAELNGKLYDIRAIALKQLKLLKEHLEVADTGWYYVQGERVRWRTGRYIIKVTLRNDDLGETMVIYQAVHSKDRIYYVSEYSPSTGKYEPEWILGTSTDALIKYLRNYSGEDNS